MATALSLASQADSELSQDLKRSNILLLDETQNEDVYTFGRGIRLAKLSSCLQKVGLVGDKNQIQPIGIGKPYLDLIDIGQQWQQIHSNKKEECSQ